jgi:U3 small nucleolar RNA-associated protein 19
MALPKLPKSKASKPASTPKNATSLARIAQLESSLLEQTYNPNNLVPLIRLSRDNDPEVVHKSIWALHRVFVNYIQDEKVGGLTSAVLQGGERDEGETQVVLEKEGGREVKSWVRERLLVYVEVLGGLLRDSEEGLRVGD